MKIKLNQWKKFNKKVYRIIKKMNQFKIRLKIRSKEDSHGLKDFLKSMTNLF